MKFICLGYYDAEKMDARPKAEIDALMGECRPFMHELYETGQVIVDAGLDLQTKRLQRIKGKVTVTDGPYTESKELIGGVVIIEAANMEDAIRVASLHPTTRLPTGEEFGWRMEIRPIHYFEIKEAKP